jgi:hypothetical protein
MKYVVVNDIQKNSKEIHMPQNGIVFHVSMQWVTNNIKFDFYSFMKLCGHTTWIFNNLHKSHLMI